ncbi:3-hydroxybutyrate dehydrogenase [Parasphingorhabdus halotolerans]|uniref:3-hydroxybutyrate dehydrogenase n=1 Tax=Parasphingorhabdus halotolerans TaxID=2725558 RepID=A0A6H2DK66_9SPHN|nr:3-hydroxybutyrate dehydrogenase [Parasphingorhabdus halotolerans]QJB68588.1 3-hydroxybutyrate dehydrogenase [Parasphingorhabdus halotolerans]
MFLKGKTALITGSTSGIGGGYAKALAAEGATVMINGFGDKSEIDTLCQELESLSGVKAAYSNADMTKPEEIRQMCADCAEQLGVVDILINNAGIQHVAPVDEFPEDKWDAIMDIICNSAFHTTKAVLPGMKEKGWGRIINTGSMHSTVASPYKSAYNAAKHAILGFSKTVALEVAAQGITVNTISPGYTWTPLIEGQIPNTMKVRGLSREQVINDVLLAPQPTKEFVQIEQIAALAVFLCQENSRSITGANMNIDGGWTAQ